MRYIELVNEINDASRLLSSAMDRYVKACVAIPDHYQTGSSAAKALLDCALTELPNLSVCEEKFRLAKAALRRTRNQSPDLAPINNLPFEVMSHIFWMSRDCLLSPGNRPNLVYPGVLLRVCSRWRQITLTSHQLWSHIDVHTNSLPSLSRKRAELFATQSNCLPIDLHIKTGLLSLKYHAALGNFYRSVAPRIQSFEIHHGDDLNPLYGSQHPWLDTLLSGAKAGTLTQLGIKSYGLQTVPAFLLAKNSFIPGLTYIQVSSTEQQLEELLSSVTKLHLKGVYFFWTSQAYRGLVELSLEPFRGANMSIKDTELAGILLESPGLRVLHFGLGVESTQEDFLLPVQLDDLESLQLTSYAHSSQESLLRMVHPGQAPLQVTIKVSDDVQFLLPSKAWVELTNFTARTNIVRLHIEQRARGLIDPSKILALTPHLEVLVLNGFTLGRQCEELFGGYDAMSYLYMLGDYENSPIPQQIRILRLERCIIYWSDFRHAFEVHPTEKLVLDRCEVYCPLSHGPDLETALRRVIPVVELYDTRVTRAAPGSGR